MIITLKPYLAQLEQVEKTKPKEQRKTVPTLEELADIVGLQRRALSNIVNNRVKGFTLEVGDKVIAEMRRRGFPMQVGDLLMYQDDSIQS